MKTSLHIAILSLSFFLSTNIHAQSKDQKVELSSLVNKYEVLHNFKENLTVISIFDLENMNEIKELDRLAEKYKNSNVTFIGVTDEISNRLDNTVYNSLLYYRHLSKEENKRIFNKYQTSMYKSFPIHIIINKTGEVVYKKKGTTNNIDQKLAKRIDRLLDTEENEFKPHEFQYSSR